MLTKTLKVESMPPPQKTLNWNLNQDFNYRFNYIRSKMSQLLKGNKSFSKNLQLNL